MPLLHACRFSIVVVLLLLSVPIEARKATHIADYFATSNLPLCREIKNYAGDPAEGACQLVFHRGADGKNAVATDRPDDATLASLQLEMTHTDAGLAEYTLSVLKPRKTSSAVFRVIFYHDDGYPDAHIHAVDNHKPCKVSIITPASVQGRLNMNILGMDS